MGHIHSNGEYDFAVSGAIVHKNKVLLLLHHKLNMWLMPGGHVELTETPLEAVFREVEEETGIKPDDLTLITPYSDNLSFPRDTQTNNTQPMPFDIDVHEAGNDGHRHIDFGYILISSTDKFTLEENGATDMQWFTLDEIKHLKDTPKGVHSRAEYALRQAQEIE